MEDRLPDCPFCGGQGKLKKGVPKGQRQGVTQAFIQCHRCGAKTKTFISLTGIRDVKDLAKEAWCMRV